jgi:hypothetical protein
MLRTLQLRLSYRQKNTQLIELGILGIKSWQCPTLTWGDPTLPSALNRFTSEFGMGSGGANSLLPPGKLVQNTAYR